MFGDMIDVFSVAAFRDKARDWRRLSGSVNQPPDPGNAAPPVGVVARPAIRGRSAAVAFPMVFISHFPMVFRSNGEDYRGSLASWFVPRILARS